MPTQYKPGEVEIVRKVLEELRGVFTGAGTYQDLAIGLNVELSKKIASLESVKEKWRPKNGEIYWFVDDVGCAGETENTECSLDRYRMQINNCFPDKASCEVAAAKFIKMLEG